MQVEGQNIQQTANQYSNCCCSAQPVQQTAQQTQAQQPAQQYSYQHYQYPQSSIYPQAQAQTQNYAVPASASGVNIQIFNPSVATPGSQAPSYNVNAPNYNTGTNCQCPKCTGDNGSVQNGQGQGQQVNTVNDGVNDPNNGAVNSKDNNEQNGQNKGQGIEQGESSSTTETNSTQKTEKKKVIQLTDEYIKNLENYLNSQEKEVRLNAAHEVFARLEEDRSRKDDKALTALINKMLQDPSEEIKLLALTALDSRIVTGDDYTKQVLTAMQANDAGGFGQNAVDASSILLKMSGKEIEKEVPVTETKTTKTETKKETNKKE